MRPPLVFEVDSAGYSKVDALLRECDADFVPPLSQRVDLAAYARKITAQAARFEAWSDGRLVGLIAVYCNNREVGVAFITNVCIAPAFRGRGLASELLTRLIDHTRQDGWHDIQLEVDAGNDAALALYRRHGFEPREPRQPVGTPAAPPLPGTPLILRRTVA